MTNDFIVIVGERDQERFRRFRTGHDRDTIKTIEMFSDADNIWAIGPSTSSDIWSSIQKDDRVFFAEDGMPFRHCGIVLSKISDQSQAIEIWGDTPRMREHERIILFSTVHDVDILFSKLCNQAGIDSPSKLTNIYLVKNNIAEYAPMEEKITGIITVSDDGAPNKKSEVVMRFIRNTRKVKQLKLLYHNECQVCGHVIKMPNNTKYSEVHHIRPLGDGGDDDFNNMLVLCPTHHAEFDYKAIGINVDKKTIIDLDGNKIGTLTTTNEHKLNEKNIQFHLMRMGIL